MTFIDNVLQKPSYGWADENGELIVPTKRQMFKQAVSNINIFKTRKNIFFKSKKKRKGKLEVGALLI
jgi:hypothetical protein